MHLALSGAGPFTLFLMVNSAFSNLTQEEVIYSCIESGTCTSFIGSKLHRLGKTCKLEQKQCS